MAIKTKKEQLAWLREQFGRDLARLKEEYENLELAQITGIDPGNLSSYSSGRKQPGIKVLQQFYEGLIGIVSNPFDKINNMEDKKPNKGQENPNGQAADYSHEANPSGNVDEPAKTIPLYSGDEADSTKELIATLKINNAHLRNTSDKMLESSDKLFQLPYKWLDSFDKMLANQDQANQIVLKMTEAHTSVINLCVQKFGAGKVPKG